MGPLNPPSGGKRGGQNRSDRGNPAFPLEKNNKNNINRAVGDSSKGEEV